MEGRVVPELRRDPTTDEWVIIAAARGRRPGVRARSRTRSARHHPSCPFCPGNEEQTPPEILRRPASGPWRVRVVPNKYPALVPDPGDELPATAGLLERLPARGHYEVIVEGREHRRALAPPNHAVLREVLLAARDRTRTFAREGHHAFVTLFKNHGAGAGASLAHPHWQLAAGPVISARLARMVEAAREYRQAHGRSLFAELLRRELAEGTRTVAEGEGFVALAAYAPQWSGESWILPRQGPAGLGEVRDDDLAAFARLLRTLLARTARTFDEPDCNVTIFSAPLHAAAPGFRWHARIQPRLSVPGGFELGCGLAIVMLAPEETAERLRAAGR